MKKWILLRKMLSKIPADLRGQDEDEILNTNVFCDIRKF